MLECYCHVSGGIIYNFPYPMLRQWRMERQLPLWHSVWPPDTKIRGFISWLLLGDPSLSNRHTCASGVSTHPSWPTSEEKYSTIDLNILDKRKRDSEI